MYKIANVSQSIEVGDMIHTNGDGADRELPFFIEGVVGKVGEEYFHVFHNDPRAVGRSKKVHPEKLGYRYSWCIGLNSPAAISLLEHVSDEDACEPEEKCPGVKNTAYDKKDFNNCTDTVECAKPKPMGNILNRISVALRSILDNSKKAQLLAGFRDENLELTTTGRLELLEILAEVHKEAFTARANEVVAENKEAKENC